MCLPDTKSNVFVCYFRNEKQIDFAEQLESVAFCLCGDEPIKVHQFYQIFNAKGVKWNNLNLLSIKTIINTSNEYQKESSVIFVFTCR